MNGPMERCVIHSRKGSGIILGQRPRIHWCFWRSEFYMDYKPLRRDATGRSQTKGVVILRIGHRCDRAGEFPGFCTIIRPEKGGHTTFTESIGMRGGPEKIAGMIMPEGRVQ